MPREGGVSNWNLILACVVSAALGWASAAIPVAVTPAVVVPPAPVIPDVPPAPEPQSEPAMVIVTDAAGKRISDEAIEAVAAKLAVGQWRVQAIPKPGDVGWLRAITVAVVDQPIPVPPAPVPPVPPGPKPPEPGPTPVVSGKRELMIVRETADTTPDFARTITALQGKGAAYDYLRSKGHRIAILDDQSPASVRQAWRPHFDGMTLPALVILDAETRNLLYKGPLSPTASADSIIVKLKEYGG